MIESSMKHFIASILYLLLLIFIYIHFIVLTKKTPFLIILYRYYYYFYYYYYHYYFSLYNSRALFIRSNRNNKRSNYICLYKILTGLFFYVRYSCSCFYISYTLNTNPTHFSFVLL